MPGILIPKYVDYKKEENKYKAKIQYKDSNRMK